MSRSLSALQARRGTREPISTSLTVAVPCQEITHSVELSTDVSSCAGLKCDANSYWFSALQGHGTCNKSCMYARCWSEFCAECTCRVYQLHIFLTCCRHTPQGGAVVFCATLLRRPGCRSRRKVGGKGAAGAQFRELEVIPATVVHGLGGRPAPLLQERV